MGLSEQRLYTIEVWSNSGAFIADISHLCRNRRYSMERNEAETFQCSIDMDELHRLAAKIGEHPRTLLLAYQMNLRIRRGGSYLFGAQIVGSEPTMGRDSRDISVQATGYLNLFKERYVTETFTATEATEIATGIIDAVQDVSGGDMGITISGSQFETGVLRNRDYDREEAKDKLQRLTNLQNGRFDFAFSADKVFTTYEALGATRDDLVLTYGRNIKQARVSQILPSNHITGIGSGFGADQLISIQDDAASRAAYYMREKISQFNSVELQSTLEENTKAVLEYHKELRLIPVVTITGNDLPGTFLSVGDRLFVDLSGQKFTDNVLGWYRLERMEVAIDDNDFETDISLYFDNQYVDPETGANV
jgi:hypothetical protein